MRLIFAGVVSVDTLYGDVVLNFEVLVKYLEFFKYFRSLTNDKYQRVPSCEISVGYEIWTAIDAENWNWTTNVC